MRPLLGLLTDFGTADGYVGVMKAVALGIAPDAALVDISHEIAPQDVEMGAWALGGAWRYFPVGSALLCVVDPGVGSARRAVALLAHGRYFVGPDNGLFTAPLEDDTADGMPLACVALDNPRYHLPAPSDTFHGRDIFAPCAAHLLAGVPLAALGSPVAVESLLRLPVARRAEWRGAELVGRVAHIDHYGNLITTIGAEDARRALAEPLARVEVAGRDLRARATHFAAGPADAPFFLMDSSGALAIAVRNGSAARLLGARRGDLVTLRGLTPPVDAPDE
ncbi:MAG TPA: SAM-dependent chlorinase/fluorinase [Ktedonobacterales bacterium]